MTSGRLSRRLGQLAILPASSAGAGRRPAVAALFFVGPSLAGSLLVNPAAGGLLAPASRASARASAIDVRAYGAVAGANTAAAAAANASAFARAFAAGSVVSCPARATFYLGAPVVLPRPAATLSGACRLVAGVNFPDGAPVVTGSGYMSLRVADVEAVADPARYPHSFGFLFSRTTDLRLDHVRAHAAFGIYVSHSTGSRLIGPLVENYTVRGIYAQDVDGLVIEAPVVRAGGNGASHCISVEGGSRVSVTGGLVSGCKGFGYSFAGTPAQPLRFVSAAGNRSSGTYLEGINFTDTEHFSAQRNTFAFDAHSTDFGSSFAGGDEQTVGDRTIVGVTADGVFANNKVVGSCKAGTALAADVTGVSVHDNIYQDVGACVGRAASFTGAVSGDVLTVTKLARGRIGAYDGIVGRGITAILADLGAAQTSGAGGVGTYRLRVAEKRPVREENMTSTFSDAAHARAAVLLYGPHVTGNQIGVNTIEDRYVPPHLAARVIELVPPEAARMNRVASQSSTGWAPTTK